MSTKPGRHPYPPAVRAEAQRLIVEQGWSVQRVSDNFGGYPSRQCIHNWAARRDADGNNWYDLRTKLVEDLVSSTTPEKLMTRILEKINSILEDPSFDTKKADQLSKLTKVFREIVDTRYHVQVMYQVMTDFVTFARKHYPDALTRELLEVVRDFKNEVRGRLGT